MCKPGAVTLHTLSLIYHFIDIPNMNSSCLPAEVGLNLLERGLLTTKRATLHLSEVIFPICIYAKVEWEIAKKQKLWNIVQVK